MAMKFTTEETPEQQFYVDDKTSAYGSACFFNDFPVGPYQVLLYIYFHNE
jgi:hypothetical protein